MSFVANTYGERRLTGKLQTLCLRMVTLFANSASGPRNSPRHLHTPRILMKRNQRSARCLHRTQKARRRAIRARIQYTICAQVHLLLAAPSPFRFTKSCRVPHHTLTTVRNRTLTTTRELASVLGYTFHAHS
jgi:hypothetical protein